MLHWLLERLSKNRDDKLKELEKFLKVNFKDKKLLKKALSHRSFVYYKKGNYLDSNERLEFLGDSLLNFIIVNYLYQKFPLKKEGELSKLKSVIVSEELLARTVEYFNLNKYLLLGPSEEKINGRNKPSLLADMYEAIIAAIYLDKNGGINKAREFVYSTLIYMVENTNIVKEFYNYKGELIKWSKKQNVKVEFKVISTEGEEHNKTFTVELYIDNKKFSQTQANTIKKAQQKLSKEALSIIKRKF